MKPIVASPTVNPCALKEGTYLVDLMLAHRPDVRAAMIRKGARMCRLAGNEFAADQPEWAHLTPKDYRDARAREMAANGDRNGESHHRAAKANSSASFKKP